MGDQVKAQVVGASHGESITMQSAESDEYLLPYISGSIDFGYDSYPLDENNGKFPTDYQLT